MTDAEIIKDWEKILSTGDAPIGEHWAVTTKLAKETFDMLSRQKKEIEILIRKKETLQDEIAEQQAEIERLKRQENTVAKLYYLKGVRDLAKRVREEINFPLAVWKVFDNILKELGGENDERIHRGSRH